MKLLCITDTHGQLSDDWYHGEEYDLCVLLGDHSLGDVEKVLRYIPKEKIRAIYGNHDVPVCGRTPITYFGLTELKYEVIDGVRLLGVSGSLRYKKGYQIFWEQDECSEYMEKQPEADVLLTHDLAFGERDLTIDGETIRNKYDLHHETAHVGLKGFKEYLTKYPNCKHIHGHVHKSYEVGNTRSVYMTEVVEV